MKRTVLLGAVVASLGTAAFALLERKASRGTLDTEPDALLILGCRVRGDTAEPTLRMRSEAAARYLLAHPSVLAVPGGGIVHDDQTKSEAQAIREILLAQGVDDARILPEEKSKTTMENFLNAKALLVSRGRGDAALAVLSSEFHLLRAGCIGRLAGVRAKTLPAPSPKGLRFKNYVREALVFPLLLTELPKRK